MPSRGLLLLALMATLSACSKLPFSQPATPEIASQPEPLAEPAILSAEPPKVTIVPVPEVVIEVVNTADSNTPELAETVPEPSVDISFFGLPTPEVDFSIIDLCQEIGDKLSSVSVQDCLDQQLQSTGGFSVLKRPLAVREYPELPQRESLGRVLLIGGIHGDEYSSVSIAFKWMEILNEYHSGVFHWQFIPLSNPDGLLGEESRRQNENGVDLNRNFPSADWNDSAASFWEDKTDSNERRYPGESGGSEPEVAWLVKHINEFQPDVIISVHAPYHLVDYDGPPAAPEQLGDLHLNRLGVYPGSLGHYAGVDLDKPVVTIELPYAGIMPSENQISKMWTDLVAWLVEERTKER